MWQSPGCAQPGGTGLRESGRIRAPRWMLLWDNTRQGIQGWDVLQGGQRAEVAEVKVTSWGSGRIWAGLGAAPAAPCSSLQLPAPGTACSLLPVPRAWHGRAGKEQPGSGGLGSTRAFLWFWGGGDPRVKPHSHFQGAGSSLGALCGKSQLLGTLSPGLGGCSGSALLERDGSKLETPNPGIFPLRFLFWSCCTSWSKRSCS